MTRRQMFWSGLLALTLLRIILDLPLLNWRVSIFNLALYALAYRLGRMKPAVVRISIYEPPKVDVTDEMNQAMQRRSGRLDLTPGKHR